MHWSRYKIGSREQNILFKSSQWDKISFSAVSICIYMSRLVYTVPHWPLQLQPVWVLPWQPLRAKIAILRGHIDFKRVPTYSLFSLTCVVMSAASVTTEVEWKWYCCGFDPKWLDDHCVHSSNLPSSCCQGDGGSCPLKTTPADSCGNLPTRSTFAGGLMTCH